MIPRCVGILFVAVAVAATLGTAVRAENLPTLSIRYMTIEADVIVVGAPVVAQDGALSSKYKVTRVLKGPESLVGREVTLRDEGLYSLPSPSWLSGDEGVEPTPRITRALLFLRVPGDDEIQNGYRTVLSGIRALTEKGSVLVPQQFMNPGPQYLLPMKGETWDAMLAQVVEDSPKIAQILRLGDIVDRGKRNQVIFTWIQEHRDEFGGGYFGTQGKGWASLEQKLFDWIMESCIPEDCWRAIQLSSALGTDPQRSHPSFCSKEGRALLMAKVLDRSLPDELRLRALRELGAGSTFWYAHRSQYPRTLVVTRDEQETIIDHILPILTHKEPSWRAASARCLMSVSWPYDANFEEMTSKRAIPDFVTLYKSERSTEVRNIAVQAIRRIETESSWQKLSGNPEGIVVFLRFAGINGDVLKFDLDLEHTRAKITEIPVFRFQELREGGSAVPPRVVEPTVSYPEDLFRRGWEDWQGMIIMTIPAAQVNAGLWRVSAEGRLGGHTWRSEPVEVTIPDKKKDE